MEGLILRVFFAWVGFKLDQVLNKKDDLSVGFMSILENFWRDSGDFG